MSRKEQMGEALRTFINQRSGIEWSREAFLGDYRPILKYGRHARERLRAVELRESITADARKEFGRGIAATWFK